MRRRLTDRIAHRPVLALAIAGAVTVVCVGLLGLAEEAEDLDAFTPSTERSEAFDQIQDEFAGGAEVVQVIYTGAPTLLTGPDAVAQVETAVDRLQTDPTLASVMTSVVPFTDPAASDLGLVSPNGQAGIVAVSLEPGIEGSVALDASRTVVGIVEAVDGPLRTEVFSIRLFDEDLSSALGEDLPILLLASLAVVVIILAFAYRTVVDTAIGVAGLLATIVWMLGLAAALGPNGLDMIGPFTEISTIAPVLLIGLAIDFGIHLTVGYRQASNESPHPADTARTTMRRLGPVLAVAAGATAIGFLTNGFSPLPPIRDFGVLAALGVASAYFSFLLVVPSLRQIADHRRATRRGQHAARQKTRTMQSAVLAAVARWATRHRRRIGGAVLAVTVLAGAAALQLNATFSTDAFVPSGSASDRALEVLDIHFGGDLSERAYVLVDAAEPDEVAAFSAALGGSTLVQTRDGQALVESLSAAGDQPTLVEVATQAGQDRASQLDAQLTAAAAAAFAAPFIVTGETLVFQESIDALTSSQTWGVAVALVAALGVLLLYYGLSGRGARWAFVTVAPSALVAIWTLGAMWALGISFNILTAMVSALAVALGVPYAVHLTNRHVAELRTGSGRDEAIGETWSKTGGAVLFSALTSFAAFAILSLSSLTMIREFGIVTALAIALSALAALVVQPALAAFATPAPTVADDPLELASPVTVATHEANLLLLRSAATTAEGALRRHIESTAVVPSVIGPSEREVQEAVIHAAEQLVAMAAELDASRPVGSQRVDAEIATQTLRSAALAARRERVERINGAVAAGPSEIDLTAATDDWLYLSR